MFKLLFLIILFFTVPLVQAHIQTTEEQDTPFKFKKPHDTAPFEAAEHKQEYGCAGYVRAGYIQTDHLSGSAVAGELGCGYQLNLYIKAHLGLFASYDFGVNSHDDDNIQGDFFNSKKDSYLIVGEAVLSLSYGQFDAHLGRQKFDSPHMDADDLRMIPNLFEAYLLDYHFTDELSAGAGFVREAAGWENGANASQFVSIGEALGGDDRGAWVSWLNYQQENIAGDAWFYYIPEHLTIFYTEVIFSDHLSDDLSYSFGLQYDWGKDSGKAKLGRVDAHTIGVMAAVEWTGFTFTAAYNKNFGDTGALASIGGGPFFTSVEELTLDAVNGENSQSFLLSLEYIINNNLTLGAAGGKFSASNKKTFNQEELNVFINYNWNDKVAAELMYAVVDDLNSEPDMHQVRVILTYQY
jgi:hypothetical protein